MTTFQTNEDISQYHGFVYHILEKDSGKFYIGKKQFFTKHKVESNWKSYTSSCKELSLRIKKDPTNYEFKIIVLCKDEPSLKYCELKEMCIHDCLTNTNSYNNNMTINMLCKLKNFNERTKYL